jgi:hypothetical protein
VNQPLDEASPLFGAASHLLGDQFDAPREMLINDIRPLRLLGSAAGIVVGRASQAAILWKHVLISASTV